VYYEADFEEKTIYMLAFLSPALTPEELYLLDDSKVTDAHNPIRMSVDAVRDVESVYDLTEGDFEDLKLYHLGPCRALPSHLLQPSAWRKVLPEHFCNVRERALERARNFEDRYGKIQYNSVNPGAQSDMQPQHNNAIGPSKFASLSEHSTNNLYGNPDQVLQDRNADSSMHQAYPQQGHAQMHFYMPSLQKDGAAYHPHPYLQNSSSKIAGVTVDHLNASHQLTTVTDVVPRPHDECEGMDLQEEEDVNLEHSSKVSVVSVGGDVDMEAGTSPKSAQGTPNDDPTSDKVAEGEM